MSHIAQPALDLLGGSSPYDLLRDDPGSRRPSIGDGDPIPAGPYSVGMTKTWSGSGESYRLSIPYTIIAANGQCIAGSVPSRDCAEAIADALNRAVSE